MIAEDGIDALNSWLAKTACAASRTLASGFCERAVAAGLPLSRVLVFIDTLHPVYEGRAVRWGQDPSQAVVEDYGRTGLPEGVPDLHLSSGGEQTEVVARWHASPFFRMLQTGRTSCAAAWRRRAKPVLRDYRAAGMTESTVLRPKGIIGEMDCVYSSWGDRPRRGLCGPARRRRSHRRRHLV